MLGWIMLRLSLRHIVPHRFRGLLALAALAMAAGAVASCLHAQTFDASDLTQPTPLAGTWFIRAGDDLSYASANFDDSGWTRYNPLNSLKTVFPRAHPTVVWYRLHIKVTPGESGLALEEHNLSSAFDIFVNGERLIHVGRVAPFAPDTLDAYLIKPIPAAALASGSVVVAIRCRVSPIDWTSPFPGYYPINLFLGQRSALRDRVWIDIIGNNALSWLYRLFGLALGIVALTLFAAQPRQREYLWLFLWTLANALLTPLQLVRLFHTLPAAWEFLNQSIEAIELIFVTLMYFAFLRTRLSRWTRAMLGLVVVGAFAAAVASTSGAGSWLTVLLYSTPQAALLAGVIPGVLIAHTRRGNREAGILLVPALLLSLTVYFNLVVFMAAQVPPLIRLSYVVAMAVSTMNIGPFALNVDSLYPCLSLLALAVIIVLRSTRITHQQALIEGELAAAREVQRVILPGQSETVPGFRVESVYEPAEQVGGDFFQILPDGGGGLVVVVGDVAGKGLPAAMLVSALVGAVRGAAEFTKHPAELLANMNDRVAGRTGGGFSTAVVARITADGSVAIANAGHLPPYLDGEEIDLPSAFPLGVQTGARYETVHLRLDRGSRLTFYSDGIVEAQKPHGEMLGFDRARELSTRSAEAIVAAARQFGQLDDMTVVVIERAPAPVRPVRAGLEPVPTPAA